MKTPNKNDLHTTVCPHSFELIFACSLCSSFQGRMNSSFILCLLLYINVVLCYRPVVLIHGILTGAESMLVIEEEIKRVRESRSL